MSFAYRVCMSAMVDMSVAPCEQESSDLTDGQPVALQKPESPPGAKP